MQKIKSLNITSYSGKLVSIHTAMKNKSSKEITFCFVVTTLTVSKLKYKNKTNELSQIDTDSQIKSQKIDTDLINIIKIRCDLTTL